MPELQTTSPRSVRARILYSAVSVAAIFLCLWGILDSARAGTSRLIAAYAQVANRLDATGTAIQLSPSDPEAHYTAALMLADAGHSNDAIQEMERAIALRPDDYLLWLELGGLRERAGSREQAGEALRQAVRLAPYYAKPRWELGNLLFRMGARDEAFAELRCAISSEPSLLLTAVDFAWIVLDGDAQAVEQALQPQTNEARLTLARFFAKRGEVEAAINLFRQAGGPADDDRRALINQLLADKKFDEAYKAWLLTGERNTSGESPGSLVFINDGGFETSSLKDIGFGWQAARDVHTVRAALDETGAHGGQKSLRLEWSGESDPNLTVASQLALVEPNTQYSLRFAARTEKIVTGGLPLVTVTDISGDKENALAQSPTLPQGTSDWTEYTFSFKTQPNTRAVRISIRRNGCQSQTCPVFGRVWFDDFSLTK